MQVMDILNQLDVPMMIKEVRMNGDLEHEEDPGDSYFPPCKDLVVIEGPAGAGKSYRISQEIAISPAGRSKFVTSTYHQLSKSRFDFSAKAPVNSLYTDTSKAIEALTATEDQVFLDRFYLSQYVYQAIRDRGRSVLDFAFDDIALNPIRILEGMQEFLGLIDQQLCMRGSALMSMFTLRVMLVVPPWDVVKTRREANNREYPMCELDWHLYNSLANYLEGTKQTLPVPVTILRD